MRWNEVLGVSCVWELSDEDVCNEGRLTSSTISLETLVSEKVDFEFSVDVEGGVL